MSAAPAIILGIDPGYGRMGYGVVESRAGKLTCITYGCIETPKTLDLPNRLLAIAVALRDLIREHKPTIAAIETIRFAQNQTTGIQVAEARGVALVTLAEHQVPILELTPLAVKEAMTNYGHAEKRQVQQMVRQLLSLPNIPKPDDAADALAIALAAEPQLRFLLATR